MPLRCLQRPTTTNFPYFFPSTDRKYEDRKWRVGRDDDDDDDNDDGGDHGDSDGDGDDDEKKQKLMILFMWHQME